MIGAHKFREKDTMCAFIAHLSLRVFAFVILEMPLSILELFTHSFRSSSPATLQRSRWNVRGKPQLLDGYSFHGNPTWMEKL
jgi:hypothetical protein